MLPVLELSGPLFLQSQIGLVHKSGALQGVAGTLVPQVMMRDPSQFVVNERNR